MNTATKPAPASKPAKPVKDLTPLTTPKGGVLIALLLPAVQKVRE